MHPANASFLTINYNPFKPSIMAAGCSDRSIQLFNTNNLSFSNLYSTLYHMKNEDAEIPSCIETEFEVMDLSWNTQNPSMNYIFFKIKICLQLVVCQILMW